MEATLTLWQRFARFSQPAATSVARSGGACAARLACSLWLSLTLTGSLAAQDSGLISGRIVSNLSGEYLAGAEVSVEGSDLRTSAGRDGSFTLAGVPVGSQVVVASYPSLDSARVTVEVKAGETTRTSLALGQEVLELERFVVRTAKEGMAQAVALQKVSIQSKLVAAADQFGEISEGNVGEYLKFLPGVTVDYNVNDARGISLRGLSTAFTIVAVDGTPMAGGSSVDDTRRFEFEQIAMNNVETTELFKTVTPDIPAAATGGYVNFVTKSAFDRQEVQELSYNLSVGVPHTQLKFGSQGGLWGRGNQYPIRPSLDLNFSRRLNDKVGVNLNYRYSDKYDDAPRTIENWTIANGVPSLGSYTVQDEQKLTHREAFAAKVDFKLSEDTTLFVAGQWNFYDLLFTQRGLVFNLGSNPTVMGDSVVSGTSGTRTITNSQLQRRKWGETYHFNGTLEHKFGNGGRLSVTPYWSQAKGYYDDVAEGFISSNQTLTYSAAGSPFNTVRIVGINDLSVIPAISLTQGTAVIPLDYIRNLGNYSFSNTATGGNFQSRPWQAVDEKSGVNGSYSLDLGSGSLPVKVTSGFAVDAVERDIKRPTYRGVVPAVTGEGLRALRDPRYTKDVAYGFGSIEAVDPYLVWQTYGSVLSATPGVNDLRHIEEDNTAAFIRLDIAPRSDILVVGGVRWEERKIKAQASQLVNGVQENAVANLAYSELYPSIGFKYTPRRNLVVRAGLSRTVGHPDYSDILPLVRLESSAGANDGTITAPDPGLQPYFTRNYDLSADYYLSNSGVVGLALFRKEVENFISPRAMSAAELAAAATLRGYSPADFSSGSISVNGGASTLQGLELSYAQNLTMLPKPFNALTLQANFTYVDIQADDLDTLYSQRRAVSPKTANLIVGYRYGKFSTTITTNWVDESLYGGFVNTSFFAGAGDNRLLRMKDEFTTTDIKVEWAFDKRLAAYVLIRNVFNKGRREFFRGYVPQYSHIELPMRYGEFGEPYVVFGVRGRF